MMANYHQLNPIIRLKEETLLSAQVMEQLITAADFEQVEQLLATTIYGTYLSEDFQATFESSLDHEFLVTIKELIEWVPDIDILRLYMLPFTFHNLKILTKESVTGKSYSHLLIEDGFYTFDEIRNAIQTGTSEGLPDKVLETIQEVREYIGKSAVLQGIDIIYDRRYLHEQRRLADKINIPALTEAVTASIDLTNLTIAARCVLQHRSRGFMAAVLVSVGRIEKETLLDFAEGPFSAYIAFLQQSPYQEVFTPLIQGETLDFAGLAVMQDNLVTEHFNQAQIDALGPLPLLAFINAKEREIQNLRLLLVGKRSGFTKGQIRERMRDYGE